MNAPSLHVAVSADVDPCWLDLLVRSGLPVRWLGTCDHSAAVLFLPDRAGLTSAATRALVDRCQQQGLGIVAGAHWGSVLLGGRVRTLHATEVVAGERGLPASPVRLHCDVEVLAGATAGRVWPADIPAVASARSPAPVLVLPLPTTAGLLGSHARTVPVAIGVGRPAGALVMGADHAALRRLCTVALASMAHRSGRPFARLGSAPRGFAGTLAVRVDAGAFMPPAAATVLASLHAAGQRATWFLDIQQWTAAGGREAIAHLVAAGHEVQSHCFRHYAWRSGPRNRDNLRQSIAGLTALGIRATAAAVHDGNAGLAAVVRECGLDWWSGPRHDDVPGTFGGDPEGPWQVPVHPVRPASLLDAGCSEEEVNDWFGALLLAKLREGEPAVLHGRVAGELDRCPGLLPHLDRIARSLPVPMWRPTLGELFAFHRARALQPVECRLGPDTVHGEVDGPAELWIDQPDGMRVTVHGSFVTPRVAASVPELGQDPVLIPAGPRGVPASKRQPFTLGGLLRDRRR